MAGGKKKVTHTKTCVTYVWPFCYHQALKGQKWNLEMTLESF